ncbi:ribonuclease P protein component [Flavilitoribacter nigricans DSM 23189 = NBRC 102662]|uniref:Ribonuclease P protein component n=1 Tax=Flavilitoribacter nigricans (strain ATCC 23147 / DSM 23189 / NBRC 102662 / NCIMB 1420 / SS-2) TaxID=1122177 RepID=A0A2D0NB16_FLAN2|nr:ribonuclease P protein component [Flavilitoribacter nigricans DSM 23189 = NBRC 102662]
MIQAMFSRQGESFGQYPLRLVWMPMEERRSEFPVQFGLSVPKRHFKKAVQRNVLRRKIREAYRLNKYRIYRDLPDEEQQYGFMVLYTGREMHDYETIEKAMQQMIRRFIKKVKQGRK